MKQPDKKIKSIIGLIEELQRDTAGYDGPIWYRGQSDRQWCVSPSLVRKNGILSERNLIKKFKQNATMLIDPRPDNDFDWLFIMQHHGVPTRLLDWSESPIISMFFAICEHENKDGALWVLLPVELNKFSQIEPDYSYDIPSFEDDILMNYSPKSYAGETTSKLLPIAALAPRNSSRMQAQLGAFTINHKDNSPIEKVGDKKHIWRYIIPKENKNSIKRELELLGIKKFQLFPELQSICDMLKEGI